MKVPLRFTPPESDDIALLHIWEGSTPTGPFLEIDVTSAGIYPDYIREYVTTQAVMLSDWFAIQWEDNAGVRGNLSAPMQGGTTSLIGELVERVLLRSPDLDENLILQEAEATVSYIYNTPDPYSIDIDTVNRLWLTELANLAYVSASYVTFIDIGANTISYSAGMLSESSGANIKDTLDSLERLEKRALKRLGIGGSIIASIHERSRGVFEISEERSIISATRLLSLKAIVTNRLLIQDIPTGFVISDD